MLSIGCALLGAQFVVGVDVDSDALKLAHRNLKLARRIVTENDMSLDHDCLTSSEDESESSSDEESSDAESSDQAEHSEASTATALSADESNGNPVPPSDQENTQPQLDTNT